MTEPDTEFQSMRGMADCMAMVREELIEAEIITAAIAPMFIANEVNKQMQILRAAAEAEAKFADEQRAVAIAALIQVGEMQELLEMYKLEAQRWNACIHAAKDMDGEDLEHEFVLSVDKYMLEHGL